MTTVFIAGSIAISKLDSKVRERIAKIVISDLAVVVGDADGADTSIQSCLSDLRATNVTVFCSGEAPRNNVGRWPVNHIRSNALPGTRAFFTAKDVEMARAADYGLMVWDSKSTGTLNNVIELLSENKKSVVFVNKNKQFLTVSDGDSLEDLVDFMSDSARAKADDKIGLKSKLREISKAKQFALAI